MILAAECRDHPQDETADTTAALAYDAVDLTAKGGSAEAEHEGDNVIRHESLNAGWQPVLDSEIDGVGHMTHRGVRRIWMRVLDPSEETDAQSLEQNQLIKEKNTQIEEYNHLVEEANKVAGEEVFELRPLIPLKSLVQTQLQLRWRVLGSILWSENSIVKASNVGDWALVDLGECRPEQAALGDERWEWELRARAPSGSGAIDVHKVYPLPTEQFVVVRAPDVAQSAALSAKSPGTVANDPGTGNTWTNVGNVGASENAYATFASTGALKSSNYIKTTKYSFGIPEGATITGIVVAIERKATSDGSAGKWAADGAVRIIKNGEVQTAENKGQGIYWPVTDTVATYGSSSDLWGQTWSPADINNTGFGVAFSAIVQGAVTASVDHIEITVYYTEADDENRVCFAGRSIELRSDGIFRQHPTDDVWGQLVPEGFLPYASPSGLEGRESRFIVVPTSGDLGTLPDSGDNPLSAQSFTRAAYHVAREGAGP